MFGQGVHAHITSQDLDIPGEILRRVRAVVDLERSPILCRLLQHSTAEIRKTFVVVLIIVAIAMFSLCLPEAFNLVSVTNSAKVVLPTSIRNFAMGWDAPAPTPFSKILDHFLLESFDCQLLNLQ